MLVAGIVSASSAGAVERAESGRQFDPVLSLVGGCVEPNSDDPIEDPGCPSTPPPSPHPAKLFAKPTSVATDFYGNIYVGLYGKTSSGSEGRIDIFDPDGIFLTEVATTGGAPVAVQIDSHGNLYVALQSEGTTEFVRYTPTEYDGAEGEISYGGSVTFKESLASVAGMAINPANDHLFINLGAEGLIEFKSAEEGSEIAGTIPLETKPYGTGVAIDALRERIYVTENDDKVSVYDLAAPHEKLDTINGSAVPENKFISYLSLAVDEETGHLFLLDSAANRIYEFAEDGSYVSTLERGFQEFEGAQIGIDNGPFSPNGGLSTEGHYLYVPSHKVGTGHSFAFNEPQECAPEVAEPFAANPTQTEADLRGSVDACGLETTYRFEYTTLSDYEENAFANATVVQGGTLPAATGAKQVSAAVAALQSGTKYRFRLVATNTLGSDEEEASFGTYPSPGVESSSCANRAFRIGFSISLPDCRAYELVTPGDTNGRAPLGASHVGAYFTSRQVSPGGDKIPFRVEGGSLPGLGGTGSYDGDPFLATRESGGWVTAHTGPDGDETNGPVPGGSSPDQGYSFWSATGEGSKVLDGEVTLYLRYPDGHAEVVGDGTLGTEPAARGLLISENGSHTIFTTEAFREQQTVALGDLTTGGSFTLSFRGQTTAPIPYNATAEEVQSALRALDTIGSDGVSVSKPSYYLLAFTGTLGGIDVPQVEVDPSGLVVSSGQPQAVVETVQQGGGRLEPSANEVGESIYDRALDGSLRVISLLPGDIPVNPDEDVLYQWPSLNGEGVAFYVDSKLYFRYQNDETFEIGDGVAFAGVSEDGSRVFYVEGGKLLRRDVVTGEVTPFSSGAVTPVNISPDGQAAYFISTQVLTTAKNPSGVKAQNGQQNLYFSKEGDISFVGTVTSRDVEGAMGATEQVDGLGLWVDAVEQPTPGRLAIDPSRTNPDGSVIVFQSRANLTDFDPAEHPQIYRYDSVHKELDCLSCNPTTESASGDATLQSYARGPVALFEPTTWIENLSTDGRRAIFQSTEALVPRDNDGLQDVYEWEDQGVGSCTLAGGCVYLLSYGDSIRDDYLWAVNPTGDDVFVLTSDLLLPSDADETVSIYDVRVGGGFPAAVQSPDCQGEGCRPQVSPPPPMPSGNTPVTGGDDNAKPNRACPKGKRKVKRHGKVRCVKKKRRHQAGTKRKVVR